MVGGPGAAPTAPVLVNPGERIDMTEATPSINHGTAVAYRKHKCRCDTCRAGNTQRAAEWTGKARASFARGEKDVPHGLASTYGRYGCRCRACTTAATQEALAQRARNPESSRESARRWRERNADKLAARALAYHYEHREQSIAKSAAWRARNPEKMRLYKEQRRARQRGVEAKRFTSDDWRRIVNRYGGRCAYCGASGVMTRDHVVPLSRGGRHAEGNIVPACMPCNQSKTTKLLVEWRRWRAHPGNPSLRAVA